MCRQCISSIGSVNAYDTRDIISAAAPVPDVLSSCVRYTKRLNGFLSQPNPRDPATCCAWLLSDGSLTITFLENNGITVDFENVRIQP